MVSSGTTMPLLFNNFPPSNQNQYVTMLRLLFLLFFASLSFFAGFVNIRLVSRHVRMLQPYWFSSSLISCEQQRIHRISAHMKLLVSPFSKVAHLILSRNRVVGCEDLLLPLSNVHGATWQQKVKRCRQGNESDERIVQFRCFVGDIFSYYRVLINMLILFDSYREPQLLCFSGLKETQ